MSSASRLCVQQWMLSGLLGSDHRSSGGPIRTQLSHCCGNTSQERAARIIVHGVAQSARKPSHSPVVPTQAKKGPYRSKPRTTLPGIRSLMALTYPTRQCWMLLWPVNTIVRLISAAPVHYPTPHGNLPLNLLSLDCMGHIQWLNLAVKGCKTLKTELKKIEQCPAQP